jgi:hypothetical protein
MADTSPPVPKLQIAILKAREKINIDTLLKDLLIYPPSILIQEEENDENEET